MKSARTAIRADEIIANAFARNLYTRNGGALSNVTALD
jgi:hypothetical protein